MCYIPPQLSCCSMCKTGTILLMILHNTTADRFWTIRMIRSLFLNGYRGHNGILSIMWPTIHTPLLYLLSYIYRFCVTTLFDLNAKTDIKASENMQYSHVIEIISISFADDCQLPTPSLFFHCDTPRHHPDSKVIPARACLYNTGQGPRLATRINFNRSMDK